MKRLYLIGGTMGVGKTTVCRQLKKELPNSVFLDGDWCWDADPFQVTEETKTMVLQNICYLLNSFIHCTVYDMQGKWDILKKIPLKKLTSRRKINLSESFIAAAN